MLGPLLWYIAFDGVLWLLMPRKTTAIGYADDMFIVVGGGEADVMQEQANATLETVANNVNWDST